MNKDKLMEYAISIRTNCYNHIRNCSSCTFNDNHHCMISGCTPISWNDISLNIEEEDNDNNT